MVLIHAPWAFLIRALDEGTYDFAAISASDTATLSDIEVIIGEVTNIGAIDLEMAETSQ